MERTVGFNIVLLLSPSEAASPNARTAPNAPNAPEPNERLEQNEQNELTERKRKI